MSLSDIFDYNNYICGCESRLTFGVPLEDVSPRGDLHPSLKVLFNETYKYFVSLHTVCPLECLSNPLEITNTACLNDIISALTYSMPLPSILSFETLMQTLRYFLSSLPIPLLPKYTYCRDFQWVALSSQCKALIEQRFLNKQLDNKLKDNVSRDLLRLPRVNLLLIGYFVNFLRSLVRYGQHSQRYNKKAANILINYFAASIFIRPCDENIKSKQFHPLMLFLIVKWPHIQQKCIEIQPQCFQAKPPLYLTRNERNKITTNSSVSTASCFAIRREFPKILSTIEETDETPNLFNPHASSSTISTNKSGRTNSKQRKLLKHSSCQIVSDNNVVSVYTQTYDCAFDRKPEKTICKTQLSSVGVQSDYFEIKDDLYAIKDKLEIIEKGPGVKIKINSNKIKKSLNFHKKFCLDHFLPRNKKILGNTYNAGDYGTQVLGFSQSNQENVKANSKSENNMKVKETEPSCNDVSLTPPQSFLSSNTVNTFIDQEVDKCKENIENHLYEESMMYDKVILYNKENLSKISQSRSIPCSINSNNPETHEEDYAATDPLNDDCKQQKSLINLTKLTTSFSFVKQFKKCAFIKRVRSEEFCRRPFSYIKIPSKKFFTMS